MPSQLPRNLQEFHIAVIGADFVERTAVIFRFAMGVYDEGYYHPYEDSYRKLVTVEDKIFLLEILDAGNPGGYPLLTEQYIKASNGFVLVFSLTQADGLEDVRNLRDQIYRVKGTTVRTPADIPIVVVGTKSDLPWQRQVHRETLELLSGTWEVPIYEVSARMDWNVTDAFEDLIQQMRIRYPQSATVPQRELKRSVAEKLGKCIVM